MGYKKICSNCKMEEVLTEVIKGNICRREHIPPNDRNGECVGFISRYNSNSDCLGIRHSIVE